MGLSDDDTSTADISEVEDEDKEEEQVDPDASLIDKLKAKFKKSQSKNGSDKKKIKPIYLVIGLGLLVILFSDEIFPPEPPAEPVFVKPERKRPDPKPTEETPTEALPETGPTETSDTPVESDEPTEALPETEPTDTPIETEPTETSEDDTVVFGPEGDVDTFPNEASDMSPTDMGITSTVDTVDGEVTPDTETDLTDQILQDLEKQAKSTEKTKTKKTYAAPPDYEYRGRGLVYNCVGKHWACVDAPSYKTCEDNSASNKYLNKPTQCYPFNVYETVKGCENIQNRMVSSSAKTNFCNE